MKRNLRLALAAILVTVLVCGCAPVSADTQFFGKTVPPEGQVMRYVSGSEPESMDPQISTGQPEARLFMALYEGLVEYAPKTAQPIPAIAESWESNEDLSEFTFHLRKNARFSNGDPIKAQDFVWSLRRGLDPALAARPAYMAFPIRYAQGYNEVGFFIRDVKTGDFELEPGGTLRKVAPAGAKPAAGKELVPIKAEDVGIEAVDDFTVKYTLVQPAPYFVGLMAHHFFHVVHRGTIERFGNVDWTQPENIVTSGAFKLKEWVPYDRIIVVRSPMYWDAAVVRLDEIRFYPLEDQNTMMNLYKAGSVDATYNHTVPSPWLEVIMPMKDYMGAPEMANTYVQVNTKKAPMNDVRVRKAFGMAIDRNTLARFKRTVKPITSFVPNGIFPGYPVVPGDDFDPEGAKTLLAEAGYRDSAGKFDPAKFPVNDVEYSYNTSERNRQIAEYLQAQWKQNLGVTIPLKNMEWKTFLDYRAKLEYRGLVRGAWIADYFDPFSFLNIFSTPTGDNGTGWWDQKYVDLLNEANRTRDPAKRFEILAAAEKMLLESDAIIPLFADSTDWMKKPYVKGMYPNPGTLHAWKYVYIEHDRSKWDNDMPSMLD
jgi:oligopeptide transport system substrate-binding protein